MKTARLFIALQIPQKIQNTLAKQLAQFNLGSARIRPVPAQDMHITLKFLGETDDMTIPTIIQCLEEVASTHQLFDIELAGGTLLPPQRPRTISIGITASDPLQKLYDTLDHALAVQGVADQDRRRFNPHITLARIDGPLSPSDQEKILTWSCASLFFTVDQIVLIESTLRPQGPLYTILTSAGLQ